MRLSLGLICSFILFTSERVSEVDFKGVQKPIGIFVQRFSPAFAALEDTFEVKSDPYGSLKSFQTRVTAIKSGEVALKIVKLEGFKINKSEVETVVSLTKRAAVTAKSILEKSLEFNPVIDKNTNAVGIRLSSESAQASNRSIDIDGVDFEIGTPASTNQNLAQNELPLSFMNANISGLVNAKIGPISVSSKKESFHQDLIPLAKAIKKQINGQIQLAEGAVYPGERFEFYIQRIFDGVVQERGEVNAWTGEFKIAINEPRGKLNVELRHDSGALIAIGQLPLSSDLDLKQGLDVKVVPSENAQYIGQVLSYESFDDYEVAINEKSEVHIDGDAYTDATDSRGRMINNGQIAPGSQILVSASHKGYWNSLQIAEAGQPIRSVMHSDKHMSAFLRLIEPYLNKAQINSVIWGRVSDQGRPLADVKVSLHGFEDVQPLYFSFRIPDPNLESTSGDGFFAFINPPDGLHIIKSNHKSIPLESVIVRLDHTSIASLETAPKKNVNLYSYDAFSFDVAVPANVSVPGTDSVWRVGGTKQSTLPFFDTATNMVMDVEPINSAYVPTRFFIGRRRLTVQLPHFRKAWINAVLSSEKVNQVPRTTSLIGWIEEGSYNVSIYPSDNSTRVIYFDKQGRVVDQLTNGGGYLATNVPSGVVTSTLTNQKTRKMIKRLSIAEPHRLSVNYISDLN